MERMGISTALRRETGMQDQQQQQQQQCPDVWGVEKSSGHVVGEDFSIDDLLNFSSIPDEALEEEEFGEEGKVAEDDNRSNSNSCSALSRGVVHADDPLVPAEDISDLEWVSHIVDDSFVVDIPCSAVAPAYFRHPTTTAAAAAKHSRSPSAGSVTSASTSLKRTLTFSHNTVQVPSKARSKRARPGGCVWSLRRLQLPEPMTCSVSSSSSCSSTSSPSSCLMLEPKAVKPDVSVQRGRGRPPLHKKNQAAAASPQQGPPSKQHKKKGRKPKVTRPARAEHHETTTSAEGVTGRRCSHCGVQRTPQWRAGPLGAKTLCNACGVRYKSGRLLPEYRPAVSPTFLDHVHSNSHKKVLEMRRKKELLQQEQQLFVVSDSAAAAAAAGPPSPPVFLPTQHLVF